MLLRLTLDAVQQLLLMASGREAAAACCWAVYAVLNLAPALAASPVRTAAARSLLQMTAPHWAGCRWAHEFLTGTLGLPPAWLSLAQASPGLCRRPCCRDCGEFGEPTLQATELLT